MAFLLKRRQGGRKSLLPPPANHEKDPFPPKWKPIEESPLYKRGIIKGFFHVWDLETRPHMKDSEFPKNAKGMLKTPRNIHNNLKNFLKQVRESRGYDVDWRPPDCVGSPFYPYNNQYLTNIVPKFKEACIDRAKFVIQEINAHAKAQRHDKCYELHSFEKTVEVMGNRFSLLTFHVNEASPNNVDTVVVKTVQAMVHSRARHEYQIMEWRFKPQGAEDEDEDGEDNSCSTSMKVHWFLFAVLAFLFSYLLHWFLV